MKKHLTLTQRHSLYCVSHEACKVRQPLKRACPGLSGRAAFAGREGESTMRTVHEVSRLTGVSVRTLHHYDAIGLLKPSCVTQAGYRLYDEAALRRLQSILLFRELQFPLKQIKAILESPGFDRKEALQQQLEMLQLQRGRLDALIDLARETIKTGGDTMDFSAFDRTELERYAAEAKEKWGATDAYRESAEKAAQRAAAGQGEETLAAEMMRIFTEMGELRETPPDSDAAQEAVQKLRAFITGHYYNCTPQILAGLGRMYTADERFRANIDAAGGEGTAAFAGKAIEIYCKSVLA